MKKTTELPLLFKTEGPKDEAPGFYLLPHPTVDDYFLFVVFSDSEGWENASISIRKLISRDQRKFKQVERCPTWGEMNFIKDLFWNPSEVAIQFHPAMANYVNNHEYVLHIWKPVGVEFPTPPAILEGLTNENMTTLLKVMEEAHPGHEREYYLTALYHAEYEKVNIRDEKSVLEFKEKISKTL